MAVIMVIIYIYVIVIRLIFINGLWLTKCLALYDLTRLGSILVDCTAEKNFKKATQSNMAGIKLM